MPRNGSGSTAGRQRHLLQLARAAGKLEVTATAKRLEVSAETLRRDLRTLEKKGLIRRSYGTIVPTEVSRYEREMEDRQATDLDEKHAITAGAMTLLEEAGTLFLDEGMLPQLMVRHLPVDRRLTVVTSSLPVATAIADDGMHDAIVLGGRVRQKTLGVVDHWAADMLRGLVIDVALLGTNGVSFERGLTTPDPAVAATKAAAVRAARRRILVCEHTKFGVTSFAQFATLGEMDVIVTGTQLSGSAATRITQLGPRVAKF